MSKKTVKIREVHQVFFIWMLTISFFTLALLTAYGLWVKYRNYQQDIKLLRVDFEAKHKKLLQDKVNEAIAFSRFKAQSTEDRLKKEIKSRALEGWEVAQHLYFTHRDTKSDSEIAELIKDALRPIRFKGGRGYFFIVSMDGFEELYPIRPELEGVNLWKIKDIKGNFVFQQEIEVAREKGEGFVKGYWPNPKIPNDAGSLEYSYVKHFVPLNWLIGTGEFFDDVHRELQKETLEWLAKIRYGNDSYIFVDTYDGKALLMDGDPVRLPRNIWDLKDSNGGLVTQEETRIAKQNKEGGFLEYSWLQPGSSEAMPVLSFVRAIPEWEWVVGSSIYLNDIELAIEKKRVALLKNVHLHLWFIFAGVILAIPIVALVAYYGARKFDREFQVFLSYFRREEGAVEDLPSAVFSIREFTFLAEAAHSMILRRQKAEEQLKVLSLTDPLTGLANRREMESRIISEAARSQRSGLPISFVLLDVDLFKKVNDNHGHDYGDHVLKKLAELLVNSVRRNDLVCRWGGEEFLLMVPDTDLEGAYLIAEKIRKKVMESPVGFKGEMLNITVTCGISVAMPGEDLEGAINRADEHLLKGKRAGRNRVEPAMESSCSDV
jgi:diguanylate cyclase (GGDEF)-like protein